MIKILLVEDEPHKREELAACLEEFYEGEMELRHVDSVHSAFWDVSAFEFNLIVLDMALPTFTVEGDAAERGFDQAQGGVEVLRALKARGMRSRIIVITQYPDITFGGTRLKLADAPKVLSQRYDQDVIGSVLYKYKSPLNKTKITTLLKKLK
jgi:CheY-like chemotaxis protein